MPLQGEYAPLPAAKWVRDQVETWERTNGQEGNTLLDTGMPVVIVVNRGARSGQLHRTPLMRVEHEGDYLAVGSKGGAPENPVWVNNIRTHPEVEVWDRSQRAVYTVREIDGDERAGWWDRAVAAYPPYAEYQTRTDRLIPLFVLEPAGS